MSTPLGTPTQRVPAWKRLGLKLKGAASDHSPASADHAGGSTAANANGSAHFKQRPNAQIKGTDESIGAALSPGKKRKQPPQSFDRDQHSTGHKHRRQEDSSATSKHSSASKTPKSVRFANGIDDGGADKPGVNKALQATQPKSKAKKGKKRKQKKANGVETAPKNIDESLKYLRQWDTDRKSWKFNKNHQTLLLKYVFEGQLVPASDINTFYKYIRTVAGFARSRLRETAQKVKDQDMEQGPKAFPATVKDAEAKQVEYEHVLAGLLPPAEQDKAQEGSKNRLKRPFDEAEFVVRTTDLEIRARAVKRIRAEIILDELSDSEESSTSSGVPTTPTTTASNDLNEDAAEASGEKRARLTDAVHKKVRRRKLRVAIDDETSDSESDSESSSSDSSSSDSDESDSEEGARVDVPEEDAETSSSSSSSSSGSESGTDDESASVNGDPGKEGILEDN